MLLTASPESTRRVGPVRTLDVLPAYQRGYFTVYCAGVRLPSSGRVRASGEDGMPSSRQRTPGSPSATAGAATPIPRKPWIVMTSRVVPAGTWTSSACTGFAIAVNHRQATLACFAMARNRPSLQPLSAAAHANHLLAATVQFLNEMVIVEVTAPHLCRMRQRITRRGCRPPR